MKKLFFLISLLSLALPLAARAELVRESFEGVKPTGMGGAYLALSEDQNALFYNPAGLAYIRGGHFQVFDFTLGAESFDTLTRITNAFTKGEMSSIVRPDLQTLRISIRPSFLSRYFGFSIYQNAQGFFDMGALKNFNPFDLNSYSLKVDLYAFNDLGVITGFGVPVGPYAALGMTFRVFQRTGVDANISIVDLASRISGATPDSIQNAAFSSIQQMAGLGWALGVNAGGMFTVPLPKGYPQWKLAATVNDFGNTSFRPIGKTGMPPSQNATYHFGTALKYQLAGKNQLSLALDVRHAFENLPLIKQLHIGGEYHLHPFSFRAGFYQGYPTLGFSCEFPPHTKVHLSTYANELGNGLFQRGIRSYLVQFSIGFDPT